MARAADPPADAEELRRKLDAARGEIRRLTERLRVLAREEGSLSRDVQLREAERRLAEGRLEEAASLLQEAEARELEAEAGRRAAEAALATSRRDLARNARAALRVGAPTLPRLALSAGRARELAFGWEMAGFLARRASRGAARSDMARRASELARDLAAARAADADRAREVAAVHRQEAASARRSAEDLLARVQSERAEQERLLEEEAASARRLGDLLAGLESTSIAVPPAPEGESILARKGALPWPARGPVVRAFGRHRHPRFGTVTISNGIDIQAPAGSPVACVAAGRIVYADWFTGFGYLVIVDHGDRVFSLYAHVDGVAVAVGQDVAPGEPLAVVSDTGSVRGPGLYFEIRRGDRAVNPVEWLASAR